jgi:conjugative relaxase-like TrwC/TraI family protein
MLTLAKVTDAGVAASYYEATDNYYSERNCAPSAWHGQGADTLGLKDGVRSEVFADILSGRLPDGSELPHTGEEGRRAATDMTFSAPKSVSVMALVASDQRLVEAHERAVTKALDYYEQRLAAYRVTLDKVTTALPSSNIVAARFQHDLSRDADPQLHTHCVVANMTRRPDGEWRALDVSELYKQQKMLGALYRAELAREAQALGYGIDKTGHGFELQGVPQAVIEVFSTRSRTIADALVMYGKDRDSASAAMKEFVTLGSRATKGALDRGALAEQWRERAEGLGLDLAWRGEGETLPGLSAASQGDVTTAVAYAIEHLTEREAVVPRHQVVQVALEEAVGFADIRSIEAELARLETAGAIVTDGERLTTSAAQQREQEILTIAARGQGATERVLVQRRIALGTSGAGLNAGQQAAADLMLNTTDRVVAVHGSAGVGKTHTLARVVEQATVSGWLVRGVAPSAAATRELAAVGIEAETIAAFLTATAQPLDERTLLLVDEASMVSAKDMHAILSEVEERGAKAVLVGDTRQLEAIEAGAPFRQLIEAGVAHVNVGEIVRQRDLALRQAVTLAAGGKTQEAVRHLAPSIVEVAHYAPRLERIACDYAALNADQRQRTLVVASTRNTRAALNDLIRQKTGMAGKGISIAVLEAKDLTEAQARMTQSYRQGDIVVAEQKYEGLGLRRGDQARVVGFEPGRVVLERLADGGRVEWQPARNPHFSAYNEAQRDVAVGDLMRFTRNDYGKGIINSELGRVTAISLDASRMTLETAGGKEVSLPTDRPVFLDHGYCVTAHAAQGKTTDRVMVEVDAGGALTDARWLYVAVSRARNEAKIYTDDRQMLEQAVSSSRDKSTAMEVGGGGRKAEMAL